jgi:hypothetical protein
VEAYKDPTSGLSLRAAVSLYHCNKDSITHHLNDTPEHRYAPDVYIDRQRLSPAEETALVSHIRECYQSMLPVDVKLLHSYANELLRARGDDEPVGKNWHHKFYERHPSVKTMRARPMEKDRLINEDADDYIKWFRAFIEIVNKWGILLEDTYNMDESGSGLGLIQKSYIISPEEEKDARIFADTNREWATLIETINAIGKALKPFFINKGAHVLRDLMKAMIKSGATLATTHNGWSNDEMALEYLKHFHRHARPIGVYRLLILDGHGSYATFRFKELAHEYKIILLYLPAHITHRLQPLDVGIFGP